VRLEIFNFLKSAREDHDVMM